MSLIFEYKNNSDLVAVWQILQEDYGAFMPKPALNLAMQNRRIMQKNACLRLVSLFAGVDQEIIYDTHGKPHFTIGTRQVSFSHSGDYAAIMISDSNAGIDFELIRPKVMNIIHKFMNEEELKSLNGVFQAEHAHVYWGAKEALYKVYGKQELIFKNNIIIDPFSYTANKGYFKAKLIVNDYKKNFRLYYEVIKGYMLVHIVNPDQKQLIIKK